MSPAADRRSGRWAPAALVGRRPVMLLGALVFAVWPLLFNPYFVYAANLALVYILLAVGLNFVIGYAGQLAFANAALFGIGSYTTGLLIYDAGWPFWLALPAGAVMTMVVGVVVALPALRLRGLYLALGTVAFAQFALWVFIHWDGVTYGNAGFVVPPISFAGVGLNKIEGVYYLSFLLVVLALLVAYGVIRSRVGRALIAIRESEVAAEALGIDITVNKTVAYGLSALYAGVAGGLFTALLGVVVPESFNLFQVVLQFCMVIVGGLGSVAGAAIGAVALITLQESLRGLQEVQEIAFGGLLLVTLLFFQGGIAATLKRWVPGWQEPCHRGGRER